MTHPPLLHAPCFATNTVRHAAILGLAVLLSACTVGPDYRKPESALPAHWQAPRPHEGDPAKLIDWWAQFDDPNVAALIALAEHDSPGMNQALARIEQSRASVAAARSALLPDIMANASDRRSGGETSLTPNQRLASGALDALWEVDLFGANRRDREAAQARLEGAQAAWHDARVSLAAEVALEYLGLRTCEAQLADSQADFSSRQATATITQQKVRAGFGAPADGALAQASAADAQTHLLAQRTDCEISMKALVALTGEAEPALRSRLATRTARLPQPATLSVPAMPVQTLSARPDLASAERALAAASADIGSAEAARYPRLSLSGSIGLQYLNLGGAKQSGNAWSFGPALELPVFDAGRRMANAAAARARYDEALAAYKARVRTAVREVEQALVRLATAAEREAAARQAADSYAIVFDSTDARWRAGLGSQLDLEETRRLAIAARTQHVNVQRDNIAAWIGLYRAAGGGWAPEASLAND